VYLRITSSNGDFNRGVIFCIGFIVTEFTQLASGQLNADVTYCYKCVHRLQNTSKRSMNQDNSTLLIHIIAFATLGKMLQRDWRRK
jgi:hypothetical protein